MRIQYKLDNKEEFLRQEFFRHTVGMFTVSSHSVRCQITVSSQSEHGHLTVSSQSDYSQLTCLLPYLPTYLVTYLITYRLI